MFCVGLVFHSGSTVTSLLRCNLVQVKEFRRNVLPPTSRQITPNGTFILNIEASLKSQAKPHPKRP